MSVGEYMHANRPCSHTTVCGTNGRVVSLLRMPNNHATGQKFEKKAARCRQRHTGPATQKATGRHAFGGGVGARASRPIEDTSGAGDTSEDDEDDTSGAASHLQQTKRRKR